jgi:hypothetical protein
MFIWIEDVIMSPPRLKHFSGLPLLLKCDFRFLVSAHSASCNPSLPLFHLQSTSLPPTLSLTDRQAIYS